MGDNKPSPNKPCTRRAPIRLRSIVSGREWLEALLSGLPEQGVGERELLIRNSYRVAESDYGGKPAGFDDTGLRTLARYERDQLLFWPWVAVIELSVASCAREGWGKAELNRLLTRVFGAAESLRVRFYRRSEERFLGRAIDQTELIDRLEWMRAWLAEEGGDRGGVRPLCLEMHYGLGPDLESADARCSSTPPGINSGGDASSLNHYRRLAGQWEEEQRPRERLLSGLELIALHCWVGSQPEGPQALDPLIRDWLEAGEANQPEDWFHSQLRQRGRCNHCGNRYKLENLAICTCCSITLCPSCVGKTDRQSPRYRRCHCGGDWVG